jgi:hypothetical protein
MRALGRSVRQSVDADFRPLGRASECGRQAASECGGMRALGRSGGRGYAGFRPLGKSVGGGDA